MVNYEYPPIGGGAANANLCILKEMAAIGGVAIDLLTSFVGKGVVVEEFSPSIKIYKVGISKRNLHHWRKAEVLQWLFKAHSVYDQLLQENDYDLSHSFFAFPSGLFCWLSRKKLPYIISLRGSDVPGYNDTLGLDYFLLSPLFKGIWKNAAAIIANSKGLAELATKFTPSLPIEVIPNGVSISDYSTGHANKRTGGPFKLLTVGRLVNRKRIDCVIESISLLAGRGIDVRLDIAGDGVLADKLKGLASGLNVEGRVNFMGVVQKSDMPAVYAAADVFVMCSEHEGMSNAVLEAMAAGLPIITSHCEGIDELVADNGIVIKNISPQTVADAAGRLYNDLPLRSLMSDKSKERAVRFSWRNVAQAYMDKYCQIVSGGKV